jgi:hypothetical protein
LDVAELFVYYSQGTIQFNKNAQCGKLHADKEPIQLSSLAFSDIAIIQLLAARGES